MSYFLWFFLFLTIPVLVHLFNFRRAKKVLFTNVRFIKQVSTETKSKTRLKHYLILASRLLAFTFLILAFWLALVNVSSDEINQQSSMGAFYLDNSRSAVGDDLTDEKSLMEELIASKKSNSGKFVSNQFSGFSNASKSKSEILDHINELDASYVSRSLRSVLRKIDDERTVHLVSDFQDADLDDLSFIRSDSAKDYYLFYKAYGELRNAFVDSVWIERDLEDYSNLLLNCRLGHTDNFQEGTIVVKLLDVQGNQVSSLVKNFGSSMRASFSLPFSVDRVAYRIQLSGDDVEYDNDFYLVLDLGGAPSVLVVNKQPNRYLANVFGNSDLFDTSISTEVDYEKLAASDLVVLSGFSELPEGLIDQYASDVTFFVSPADSANLENYQSVVGMRLLPNPQEDWQDVQFDSGSKLLKGVLERIDKRSSLPRAITIFNINSPHEVVMSLRSGGTFLAKSLTRQVYFSTTPLKDRYTNFTNHAMFLPIMYKIAQESSDMVQDLYVYPNDIIEVRSLYTEVPPRIVSTEVEIIPEFTVAGQSTLLKVPTDLSPGFYDIVQNGDTLQSFGLNVSRSESRFDGPTSDQLETYFADVSHVDVISISGGGQQEVLAMTEDNSLSKYALILALLFLILETAFHRYLK